MAPSRDHRRAARTLLFGGMVMLLAACGAGPPGAPIQSATLAPPAVTAAASFSSSPSQTDISGALAHELERFAALSFGAEGLGFLEVPDPLPRGEPGALIRLMLLHAESRFRMYVMLYHSRSVDGTADVAVSGLVFVPGSAPPTGGYQIITYAPSYGGSGDGCVYSMLPPDNGEDLRLRTLALEQGYVVVQTDYEGHGTPYPYRTAIPESEAHAVLDAARAARDLLGPAASAKVVAAGYSIGADAVMSTLLDGRRYAADLDVRGIVAFDGGVDHARAVERMREAETIPASYVEAVLSYARSYDLDPAQILTPKAINDAAAITEEGCLSFRELFGDRPKAEVIAGDPLDVQGWRERVLSHSVQEAAWPVLLLIAERDNGGRYEDVKPVRDRLCAAGGSIGLRLVPGTDHEALIRDAAEEAMGWIDARMGGAVASDCPSV